MIQLRSLFQPAVFYEYGRLFYYSKQYEDKKMSPIDLHTHSNKSDGTYTPEELVRYAQEKGLSAIALTDHDTVDGIAEAIGASEKMKAEGIAPVPEVIPGVELSTDHNGKDIHIVGLFPDWENAEFSDRLHAFADARIYRNLRMCKLLMDAGYEITYEDLEAAFPDTVITRAHFAQYLLRRGVISSIEEAFSKLIGDDCPYFVSREKISPHFAVEFLLQFGGVPILAHPLQYKMTDADLQALVSSLSELGLTGIEVYYPGYKPSDTAGLCRLADQYGLFYSGGSDFHGANKKNLDLGTGYGHLYVPDSILAPLREKAMSLKK